ncbi:MAG: class I SAM-dependent methyltransferase [Verrucomicrobiaceae bacterium]|nr:MAG: class I SAM-dependent methyltransferase [Verrucomicrobiaceae bacterium]
MEGQLNTQERAIITRCVNELKPERTLEVGTWKGGGSTLHILKALEANGKGHLWGIEATASIYEQMIANIGSAGEELKSRFTPIFGFSQQVIPGFLAEQGKGVEIGVVFLDGGDNPMEQIEEFQLIRDSIPIGGALLSHDAKLRKGAWLIPYLRAHDNWDCKLHDVSDEGLFEARKLSDQPSAASKDKAASVLRSLRMQPKEFLGRHLPSWAIDLILKFLPRKLVLSITQGRN